MNDVYKYDRHILDHELSELHCTGNYRITKRLILEPIDSKLRCLLAKQMHQYCTRSQIPHN